MNLSTSCSDGRVSDGTISLIRKLLVLEPSRRLTATEVLDSLSAIITTFKVPAVIGEELQVVPDIDNVKDQQKICDGTTTAATNNDNGVEKEKKYSVKENTKLGDFSKQVTLQVI